MTCKLSESMGVVCGAHTCWLQGPLSDCILQTRSALPHIVMLAACYKADIWERCANLSRIGQQQVLEGVLATGCPDNSHRALGEFGGPQGILGRAPGEVRSWGKLHRQLLWALITRT